jgi:hypothetical protein
MNKNTGDMIMQNELHIPITCRQEHCQQEDYQQEHWHHPKNIVIILRTLSTRRQLVKQAHIFTCHEPIHMQNELHIPSEPDHESVNESTRRSHHVNKKGKPKH